MSRIIHTSPRDGTNAPSWQPRNDLESTEVDSIVPGVKVAPNVVRFQANEVADHVARALQGSLKTHVGESWGNPLQPSDLSDDELGQVLEVLRSQKRDMEQTRTEGLATERAAHAERVQSVSATLAAALEALRRVRELSVTVETQVYLGQCVERLQNEVARETAPFNVRMFSEYYPTPWRSLIIALEALEAEHDRRQRVAAREHAQISEMLRKAGVSL